MGTTVLIGRRRFLIGRTEETSGQKENKKTGKRVIFRDRGRRPASSLASGNNATRVSNGNQSEEKRQNTNWSRRASIPLPSACKADALPSELLPLFVRIVRANSLGRNVFCLLPRLCRHTLTRELGGSETYQGVPVWHTPRCFSRRPRGRPPTQSEATRPGRDGLQGGWAVCPHEESRRGLRAGQTQPCVPAQTRASPDCRPDPFFPSTTVRLTAAGFPTA